MSGPLLLPTWDQLAAVKPQLVDVYAPAAMVWAPAVATLGISEAEPISRRTAAVSVLVANGVSAVASGIPFVVR